MLIQLVMVKLTFKIKIFPYVTIFNGLIVILEIVTFLL